MGGFGRGVGQRNRAVEGVLRGARAEEKK